MLCRSTAATSAAPACRRICSRASASSSSAVRAASRSRIWPNEVERWATSVIGLSGSGAAASPAVSFSTAPVSTSSGLASRRATITPAAAATPTISSSTQAIISRAAGGTSVRLAIIVTAPISGRALATTQGQRELEPQRARVDAAQARPEPGQQRQRHPEAAVVGRPGPASVRQRAAREVDQHHGRRQQVRAPGQRPGDARREAGPPAAPARPRPARPEQPADTGAPDRRSGPRTAPASAACSSR